LPFWHALAQTHLSAAEVREYPQCIVTLAPIEELAQPVAIRVGNAVHVFDYDALATWLGSQFVPTNPANRQRISIEDILRVSNDFSAEKKDGAK
jgi:hypothetical protein